MTGPCPGNLHLYDNRYFYVDQGLGLGKCVTTLVRDAAVQVLHQHYKSPCGGDRLAWLDKCVREADATEKGRLAEVLTLDSIALRGLTLAGQTLRASLFFFQPGRAVTLPMAGEATLFVPTDRFWPHIDAILITPDSLPGHRTHTKGSRAAAAPAQPYTHIAIQVTLEDPQGSKRDKTVRFFTGPKMEAWVRPDETARWCLLWITPYSREKRTSTQGQFTFDEVYLSFGDLSDDMDFLDKR